MSATIVAEASNAVTRYRELVSGIARGQEPNHAEVERLLATTGKSIDDLRRDVERFQHRLELKAVVASLPDLDREFAKVQQQIAAADRELEVAERKHDEATGPLTPLPNTLVWAMATQELAPAGTENAAGDVCVLEGVDMEA